MSDYTGMKWCYSCGGLGMLCNCEPRTCSDCADKEKRIAELERTAAQLRDIEETIAEVHDPGEIATCYALADWLLEHNDE